MSSSNRVNYEENHVEILLKPPKEYGGSEELWALVDRNDFKKIVNYYWKAEYQNGLIVAVTRIKGEMVLMTEILFPKLKRLHRVNRVASLDNRRSNIKACVNLKNRNKNSKISKNKAQSKLPKALSKISVNSLVYDKFSNAKKELGFQSDNDFLNYLVSENKNQSFFNKLKNRIERLI